MDDEIIEYFFDNIQTFYAEFEDILNRPYSNEQDVERIVTQSIRFLVRYQKDFLKSSTELSQIAYKLIDSKLCLDYSTVVFSHIIHKHALVSQDKSELLLSYYILLYAGRDEPRWMDFILLEAIQMKKNLLFCKIMTEIRLGFYDSYLLLGASFSLLYEACKLAKLQTEDLELIDMSLVNHLLDLVEETRSDATEVFNYEVIQFILVLNEQYMMSELNRNLILDALVKRIGISYTFSANLIFMLNRTNDSCIQMLILKLLYAIFTTPALFEYFYTNDLYVLVDITLRELCSLGDTKESQILKDAYLRVLEPLLENTQLRLEPYKEKETHRVLISLLNPGMQRKVNSTTKRLVKRIIQDWWENLCGHTPTNVLNHVSSSCSLDSTGPSTPADNIIDSTKDNNLQFSMNQDITV